jgi:D-mannonate dehydratase
LRQQINEFLDHIRINLYSKLDQAQDHQAMDCVFPDPLHNEIYEQNKRWNNEINIIRDKMDLESKVAIEAAKYGISAIADISKLKLSLEQVIIIL